MIRFEVIADPVAMPRPRVAVRGGKAHGYVPSHASEAMWQIRQAAIAALGSTEPFAGPLSVTVTAYLRQPGSIPKCRRATALPTKRPDLDNLLKLVIDGCSPLWGDDSQVVDLTASKRFAVTGSPRWDIAVEAVE